ncbi:MULTISPECIES: ABC transporter permease [unclassified Nocardioides]|uniref:ABC transporter permease n=1 Tax=unclassified Nocardioides TaxID=2615069 RepID=UPI002405BF3E|nr:MULTISPECIES: ABC transporter permease [unclassified Nocardioides]MDF9716213.1 ABC transporter permease [Nocardioides sp. ChNu-99]
MSATASLRARRVGRRAGHAALGVGFIALLLLLWDLGVRGEWVLLFDIKMGFLPPPVEVARLMWDFAFGGVYDDAYSGTLWSHLGASAFRVLAGFALAAALAIPIGVLMGRSELVRATLDPAVNLFRPIPATAWVPLVLLIIGFGSQATIFLIVLSAFFPILLNTITATREVSPRLVEAARMLGTTRLGVLLKVVVPAATPGIVSGLRIGLGLGWVILVLGEANGIDTGLGSMIMIAREQVRTDRVVVGMIVIGIAGYLSDRVLVLGLKGLFGRRPLVRA